MLCTLVDLRTPPRGEAEGGEGKEADEQASPASVSPPAAWYARKRGEAAMGRGGAQAARRAPPSQTQSVATQGTGQRQQSSQRARGAPVTDEALCAAIRADEGLFERVLVLEAPHLREFEAAVKDAGLNISRVALVAFLERQGVAVAHTGNRNRAKASPRKRKRKAV